MSIFSWFKQGDARAKFAERDQKLEESQQFLIDAAVAINDVAGALTEQFRRRYEKEMQFEATSNVIEDALVICTLSGRGRVQYANDIARRDFGGDLTQLDVDRLFSFGGNHSFPDVNGLFNYLFTAESPLGVGTDGKTFSIRVKMERLNWIDGSASMMILVRRVTGQDSSDMSFDGILVVQEDHIIAANPSVQGIFGYDDVSLLGQPLSNLFPKEKADRIRMVSDNGERHLIGTHDDGRPLHLKLATVHVNKLFKDVTARLVTVKPVEIKDNGDHYSMKTDNGIDMIVSFSPDGTITFANSTFATVYGFTRAEVVKMNIKDVLPEVEYSTLKSNMRLISLQKTSLRVQLQHSRDGQSPSLHDWIWHAAFDGAGEVLEFNLAGRDISEIVSGIVTSGYF